MGFWDIYPGVLAGVILSFAWPLLKNALPKGERVTRSKWWEETKPYVALAVFSVLTALLVVAILGDSLGTDWRPALIAGYAWDSTLQKVKTP